MQCRRMFQVHSLVKYLTCIYTIQQFWFTLAVVVQIKRIVMPHTAHHKPLAVGITMFDFISLSTSLKHHQMLAYKTNAIATHYLSTPVWSDARQAIVKWQIQVTSPLKFHAP